MSISNWSEKRNLIVVLCRIALTQLTWNKHLSSLDLNWNVRKGIRITYPLYAEIFREFKCKMEARIAYATPNGFLPYVTLRHDRLHFSSRGQIYLCSVQSQIDIPNTSLRVNANEFIFTWWVEFKEVTFWVWYFILDIYEAVNMFQL